MRHKIVLNSLLCLSAIFATLLFVPLAAGAQSLTDWTTYMGSITRTGYNPNETTITAANAPNLHQIWSFQTGGAISVQPIVAAGMVFFGSWDGYERAIDVNGHDIWKTYIGVTTDNNCPPPTSVGVASTATIATVRINGLNRLVDFVGGGNANVYALDAHTGKILWNTRLGDSPGTFVWSSPAYYKGNIYIGKASFGDCPLVQGQMVKLNASTGTIQNIFKTLPDGCIGAGVWGSPTLDTSNGTLYFATGNSAPCNGNATQDFQESVVELSMSNLSLIGHWQTPAVQQDVDSDFGSTPTLYKGVINGISRNMVGVASKNGIFYSFIRNHLNSGPVWTDTVARQGDCAECGDGSISPAAYDGKTLYVGGGITTINNILCRGSVRAVNPGTGAYIWEHCMPDDPVMGGITETPGVVYAQEGSFITALNAKTGATLLSVNPPAPSSKFVAPSTISNGILYVGNLNGYFYAFGL